MTAPQTRAPSSLRPLGALYRLLLDHQVTAGRIALGTVMAVVMIGIMSLMRFVDPGTAPTDDTVGFLSVFNLGLATPVLSLVLASSSLGQLVEDETLVYVWLRPTPRWQLAAAAWLASASVAIPALVIPASIAAIIGSGSAQVAGAVAAATALAALGYTSLFTLLGLIVRRSLIWGMVYLFIWELFVARVGGGASDLSLNTYPSSVLANLTDVALPQADHATSTGVIVPVVVSVVVMALTTWRLQRGEVA